MFIPQEFIRKKRNKEALTRADIQAYITGILAGTVSSEQISAFCMAVYFNGLSRTETSALTLAMRDSGTTLSWALPGPLIDKHSTGGVGDLVSLILGPMLAACGAFVPMISGRGLGHTGGTLDKFESIPGYNVQPGNELFRQTVRDCGVAIIGQTANLAPADKRIYAIRDITATVESIELITASILAKKLAEGLDVLVLDVKVGNGAFMSSYEDSKLLAESIVQVANPAGTQTAALLTDMNQVLASSAGNALEVLEAVEYLSGGVRNHRLHKINMALCTEILVLSKLAKNAAAAEQMLNKVLESGAAAEAFAKMVSYLGGPQDFITKYKSYLPQANFIKPLLSKRSGVLNAIETREIGLALIGLGGGRTKAEQKINHSVGFTGFVQLGQRVERGQELLTIHAASEAAWNEAAKQVREAISISADPRALPVHKDIYATIRT